MFHKKDNPVAGFFGNTGKAWLLLCWLAMPCSLFSQNGESEEGATAATTEEPEEPALLRTRLSLSVTQYPGDTIELSAALRARVDNVWTRMSRKEVEFFTMTEEEEVPLGTAVSVETGTATLRAAIKGMAPNEEGYLSFGARFVGDDTYDESDDESNIRKARLYITTEQTEEGHLLKLKAVALDGEDETPLEEAEISIFVQRMVGLLKTGETTTDEAGEAETGFPADLAGDDAGNVVIVARIEDFEEYGSLATTTVQAWGEPVSSVAQQLPRNLWSPHPPTWMVITFLVLMTAVWGHYAVIIYKMAQIKKAGKRS